MRHINDAGLALIKRYEGLRLEAYRCPAGIPTIGYGHTGSDVKEGMVITPGEADRFLENDLARTQNGVSTVLELCPTSDNQYAALVSFAFNLGLHALYGSTLLKKHKARDYTAAAGEFCKWNKARVDGHLVPLAGLTARREAERKLYVS